MSDDDVVQHLASGMPCRKSCPEPRQVRTPAIAFEPFARLVFDAALLAEAFASLVLFNLLSSLAYRRVNAFTRSRRVLRRRMRSAGIERVCWAVDEACVWYVKRVYCLQRSSVATWMLRRRGIPAEVVIGYRPMPVDSHAWVEVDGIVVNDRQQYRTFFQELDRL